MKNLNVVAIVNNSDSEKTSYFSRLVASNPSLVETLKTIKKGLTYFVKNIVIAYLGTAMLPGLLLTGVGYYSLLKFKGGAYLFNKTVVYTALGVVATLAITSAIIAVTVAPVALAVTALAITTMCAVIDAYSWFKNRKSN